MTRVVMFLCMAIAGFHMVNANSSEIYRCIVDDKPQYTDQPCKDGEAVKLQSNNVADAPLQQIDGLDKSKQDKHSGPEDRKNEVEARGREMQARAAQREKDDLWKRRNMSVDCITRLFNGWAVQQNPRATPEQIDKKVGELKRECRKKYNIPQDIQ